MERLLSPLRSDATSGVGKTLIVPEPERIETHKQTNDFKEW
jgi:hypothetical protein